jgi:hypothetical protein
MKVFTEKELNEIQDMADGFPTEHLKRIIFGQKILTLLHKQERRAWGRYDWSKHSVKEQISIMKSRNWVEEPSNKWKYINFKADPSKKDPPTSVVTIKTSTEFIPFAPDVVILDIGIGTAEYVRRDKALIESTPSNKNWFYREYLKCRKREDKERS